MQLDVNGRNTVLTARPIDDKGMRQFGFTDHLPDTWYFVTRVGDGISLNISIKKDTHDLTIDVLDENFLQPYDYQYILTLDEENSFAQQVKKEVESHLAFYSGLGVIQGFMPDIYI